MLEGFDLADMQQLADGFPGPHAWTWGTDDIFYCQASGVAFEFGTRPIPSGPCDEIPTAVILG